MQITIRGHHVEVTPALRDHVEKKMGKLTRLFDIELPAHVVLSVEHGQHIVEVTVPLGGAVLRGEEETDDMYAAVDLVVDKLERQLTRYRTRLQRHIRPERFAYSSHAADGENDSPVRTKRFPAKPMAPDEAIMQMNLVGHDFYAFTNAQTERVNVVYRRKDGLYGLLEPDL